MPFLKLFFVFLFISVNTFTQEIEYIPAEINFSDKLLHWDGFGFNYVETVQTRDYINYKQGYGGFSLLNEKQKQEITELVFGDDGSRVHIVKLFLDPYHQSSPGANFDHETTTQILNCMMSIIDWFG